VWREQKLKQAFQHQHQEETDEDLIRTSMRAPRDVVDTETANVVDTETANANDNASVINREEQLHDYLARILEATESFPLVSSGDATPHDVREEWGWGKWRSELENVVALGIAAVKMCQHHRSFLSARELSYGIRAATAAGMVRSAMALLRMHIRTGLGISDEIVGVLINRLPFDCYFGRGSSAVPKVEPLESISDAAAISVAKQCLRFLRASGRIPREESIGAFVRLLARCGRVEQGREKLKKMRLQGLKPGRSVYESILRALLKQGNHGDGAQCRRDMTTLIEEMIRYGVRPAPTEFKLLAKSNLAGYRFREAKYWATKMANAGATDAVTRDIYEKIIRRALSAYKERRSVVSLEPPLMENEQRKKKKKKKKKKIQNRGEGEEEEEEEGGERSQPMSRKAFLSFVTGIATSGEDLEHAYICTLVQLGKESRAIKVLHSMTLLHTPVSEYDANRLLVFVGATKTCPQPETSIAFFEHLSKVAPSVVSGTLHGNFMGCLLSAGRVDLALKHYAKLEEDEKNAGTVLPAAVYNALLSSFQASEDLTGLKNTWNRMRKAGTLDDCSYELMIKHHIKEGHLQRAQLLFDEIVEGSGPCGGGIKTSENIMCLALGIQQRLDALKELWVTLEQIDRTLTETSTRICGATVKAATGIAMDSQSPLRLAGRQETVTWAAARYLDFARRHGEIIITKVSEDTKEKEKNERKLKTPKKKKKVASAQSKVADEIKTTIQFDANKELLVVIKDLVFALCHESIREPALAESVVSSLSSPPASCFGCLIDCLLMTGKHNRADAIVTALLSEHLTKQTTNSAATTKRRQSNAMSASIIREEERVAQEEKQNMRDAANKADSVLANVITGLAQGGRVKSALRVARRCIARGFALPHEKVWHGILHAAVEDTELGKQCWQLLEKSAFEPTGKTFTALVRTKSLDALGAAEALGVLSQMKRKKYVATQDVCSAVLESCVAGGDSDGTSKLLRMMQSRSMRIEMKVFNRMIQKAVKDKTSAALDQGMDILHFARQSGVRPDLRSCKAIMECTAKLGDASTAITLMAQMQESAEMSRKKENKRKKYNTSNIAALGQSNSEGDAQSNSRKGDSRKGDLAEPPLRIDSELCLTYVRSLSRGMEVATALDFVKSTMCAEGSGLVAGSAIWSALLEGAAKSHDLGRAEEVLSEMGRGGMQPNTVGKRALVSLFSRFNKIRRALAVIRKGGSSDAGSTEEVEWPGKSGAASLVGAICRSLEKTVHRTETFVAMEQLASVLRSASRDGRSSHKWLAGYAAQPPHCVPGKLAALHERASKRDPKWLPVVEELQTLMQLV
jgi:hypothetical protein